MELVKLWICKKSGKTFFGKNHPNEWKMGRIWQHPASPPSHSSPFASDPIWDGIPMWEPLRHDINTSRLLTKKNFTTKVRKLTFSTWGWVQKQRPSCVISNMTITFVIKDMNSTFVFTFTFMNWRSVQSFYWTPFFIIVQKWTCSFYRSVIFKKNREVQNNFLLGAVHILCTTF